MSQSFAVMLAEGKPNSLGRAEAVVQIVLHDKTRLEELYQCLFEDDAWLRMRAADALEKVCRAQPQWLEPYIDRFAGELAATAQPSIQWHLAQIYSQVTLTDRQKAFAINWLARLLSTSQVDWIVAANAMDTMVQFTLDDSVPAIKTIKLLKIQQQHTSKSVRKRAGKLLEKLQA